MKKIKKTLLWLAAILLCFGLVVSCDYLGNPKGDDDKNKNPPETEETDKKDDKKDDEEQQEDDEEGNRDILEELKGFHGSWVINGETEGGYYFKENRVYKFSKVSIVENSPYYYSDSTYKTVSVEGDKVVIVSNEIDLDGNEYDVSNKSYLRYKTKSDTEVNVWLQNVQGGYDENPNFVLTKTNITPTPFFNDNDNYTAAELNGSWQTKRYLGEYNGEIGFYVSNDNIYFLFLNTANEGEKYNYDFFEGYDFVVSGNLISSDIFTEKRKRISILDIVGTKVMVVGDGSSIEFWKKIDVVPKSNCSEESLQGLWLTKIQGITMGFYFYENKFYNARKFSEDDTNVYYDQYTSFLEFSVENDILNCTGKWQDVDGTIKERDTGENSNIRYEIENNTKLKMWYPDDVGNYTDEPSGILNRSDTKAKPLYDETKSFTATDLAGVWLLDEEFEEVTNQIGYLFTDENKVFDIITEKVDGETKYYYDPKQGHDFTVCDITCSFSNSIWKINILTVVDKPVLVTHFGKDVSFPYNKIDIVPEERE